MKTSTFLIAVVLISAIQLSSQTSLESVLSQINHHPYGKAIGSLVQMQLSDGIHTDKQQILSVHENLVSLKQGLEEAEAITNHHCAKSASECELSPKALEKRLNHLKQVTHDDEHELHAITKEIGEDNTGLAEKQAAKSAVDAKIATSESTIAVVQTAQLEKQAEFSSAIANAKEAQELLAQLVQAQATSASIELVQVSKNFINIKALFAKEDQHLDKATAAFIQPIQQVLVELSSQTHLNFESVQEVQSLISLLQKALKAGKDSILAEVGSKVVLIQEEIEDLQDQSDILARQIDLTIDRLQEANDRQQQLQTLVDHNKLLEDGVQKSATFMENLCEVKHDQCEKAAENNTTQDDILDQLIVYLSQLAGEAE